MKQLAKVEANGKTYVIKEKDNGVIVVMQRTHEYNKYGYCTERNRIVYQPIALSGMALPMALEWIANQYRGR